MESGYRFDEYIQYLRESFVNLVEYRERTGTLEANVVQIKEALFNEDPFIVFNASVAATVVLSDKFIYH
ncbi:MAG TPA: hypothetical protein PK583_06090 [Gammaproteobacteria bacterium]|jgi:hypothetical protein|nr:hypothetical protein [Gammaproteobacteria bacterium]HEV2524575.1 hypothetical protein [Gammaproteobacteria bacterium]HQW58505.1 hypothetical protein [Gammaproteobacteria bacterium]HRA42997.1 hypothetical protein [Gammaproteobacteria bacterium]